MAKLQFKWKKLADGAIRPHRAHEGADGDLGYDIYASESAIVYPLQTETINTGIAIGFPSGWGAIIKDRSGVAAKSHVEVLAGVIDPGYTGEIKVVLSNNSNSRFIVNKGDRIAQLVPIEQHEVEWTESENLENSERGSDGFGSSGK